MAKVKDKVKKKGKKAIRKNFRFTPQIADLLSDWAERLGKTENELVSTVLFAYLTDSNNFITCPEAGPDAWIKEEVHDFESISEFYCKTGNMFWFDWEKDKVIKFQVAEKPL